MNKLVKLWGQGAWGSRLVKWGIWKGLRNLESLHTAGDLLHTSELRLCGTSPPSQSHVGNSAGDLPLSSY